MPNATRSPRAEGAPSRYSELLHELEAYDFDLVHELDEVVGERIAEAQDKVAADLEARMSAVEKKLVGYIAELLEAENRRSGTPETVARAHRFELIDQTGKVRAVLGDRIEHGGVGLAIYDDDGDSRAILHISEPSDEESDSGGVSLYLYSRDGRSIAALEAQDGAPFLRCERDDLAENGGWSERFPPGR